tara:strand:+ start:818 stop:1924 length:1107 start_codon:yes stop_codon:yes gene_type:complete
VNILDERIKPDSEKYIQNLIINRRDVQEHIIERLDLEYDKSIKFTKGLSYDNKMLPDIKILRKNEILALIECKGPKINVTDYVRGIGQLFQYEHFFENNITENKTDKYSPDFKTIYLYPDEVTYKINIKNFKYPKTTILLPINLQNFSLSEFSVEQRKKFSTVGEGLIGISKYYFRDNRMFELYALIKYLKSNFSNSNKQLSRTYLENNLIQKIKVINNGNWRNAFISLSIMNIINKKNNLNKFGEKISQLNYYEFCSMVFYDYIRPYIEEIFPILIKNNNIGLSELIMQIKKKYDGKDVLFLTQAGRRYASSWLNIFRDDFGFIDFAPRRTNRIINYNPLDISKDQLEKNIIKYTKANSYLKIINTL